MIFNSIYNMLDDYDYDYMNEDLTPFLEAVYKGNLDEMKNLVLKDVDIDDYAMCIACGKGFLEIVKYLVSLGLDIQVCDNNPVIQASLYGHLHIIKYLVSLGADIKAQDNEALIWASRNGHLHVVEYLVSNGADVKAQDNRALVFTNTQKSLNFLADELQK